MANRNKNTYFLWLVDLVVPSDGQYYTLMDIAFNTPFFEVIPNDDNRAEDGIDLRAVYSEEVHVAIYAPPYCSFLEMLIAICQRMRDIDGKDTEYYFWKLLDNLGLSRFDDSRIDPILEDDIRSVLKNVVERKYRRNGQNGLFPLKKPDGDQRTVELWYQMHMWLMEQETD